MRFTTTLGKSRYSLTKHFKEQEGYRVESKESVDAVVLKRTRDSTH